MKKVIIYLSLTFIISVFIVACTIEDDAPMTCEILLQDLQDFKMSIEDFAATSICSDVFECRYIAFGSKPCGGPWSYLIYTTSINTLELEALVEDYNQRENNFNTTCGPTSDCSVPTPPIGFSCDNNQCIPIY